MYESGWSGAWNWLFGRTNFEIVGDDIAGVHQRLQNRRASRFEGVQDPEVESSRLGATARTRVHTFSRQAKVGEDVDGFVNDAGRAIVYEAVGTSLAAGVSAAFRRGAPVVNEAIGASVRSLRHGTSTKIRRALGPATTFGGADDPVKAAAHHIIPVHLFEVFGPKLKAAGIEMNSALNGVYLPTKDYLGRTAALHTGTHTNEYYEHIRRSLRRLDDPEAIRDFIGKTREELLTRQRTLQLSDEVLYQPVKRAP